MAQFVVLVGIEETFVRGRSLLHRREFECQVASPKTCGSFGQTYVDAASLLRVDLADLEEARAVVHRYQLLFSMTRSMLGPLTVAVVPRLCQSFFRFMQPLLIRQVTAFVDEPASQFATNTGWGLVGAYGLVYIGIAVSR